MAIYGSNRSSPVRAFSAFSVFCVLAAVAATAVAATAFSCAAATGGAPARGADASPGLTVASWNLQAFFDCEETGNEYEEYRASASWSEARYRTRRERLAEAVGELAEGGPDVLAVQEIENGAILESLAADELSRFGYRWTAFAGEPGGSLGVGILSRRQLSRVRAHSVVAWGSVAPRPILEATVDQDGAPLVVFVCHWKSKLGGESETEAARRASAAVLARRFAELAQGPDPVDCLALGDLNENHDEFTRRGGNEPTALMPDLPGAAAASVAAAATAAATAAADAAAAVPGAPNAVPAFLVLSGEKPPAAREFPGCPAVYSPWYDAERGGSYAYRKAWETIDHALMPAALFDGGGWEYASFRVDAAPPFVRADGFPYGYDPRTGTGLSDHLPIVVELKRSSP